MTTRKRESIVDAVTVSVVWNKLLNITNEMGERVVLSAQSFVMAAARDLGPVILDPEGKIITQVEYLPCHCLVAEIPTQAILKKFGGKLDPGDVVLANDAHIIQSGHLPDWTLLYPVYWHDELVCYVHFRGHMMDSGGAYSGSYFPQAYDCISEGINIPPIKLIEKGKVDEKVREVIWDNIRTPAGVWADVMTMVGSMKRGEEDIGALCDKYGVETVKDCYKEMMIRGEEAMRSEISQIPDGEYYGEAAVDWDGSVDKPVWIRVKLIVKGDEMTFDFSDTMEQVDFVNSPLGNTYCYTYLALYLAVDPLLPHNHGALVPINIIAPEGTVVNPTRPHTYGACACSSGTEIYEACSQALGRAMPDKTQAPYNRHGTVDVAGRLPIKDPRTGHDLEYFGAPFIEEGGSGAVKGYDGWDGMCSTSQGGVIVRGSIEECELFFPFRWWIAELHEDTEGPGQYIGSRGVYARRECTAPDGARTMLMSGDTSGQFFSPPGIAGAPYAPANEYSMIRADKTEPELFRTMLQDDMYPGDLLITKAGGGAGWGDPLDRDVELIQRDIRDELISIHRAREVYGVMVDPKTRKVDYKATEQLRKELKKKKKAEPLSGGWIDPLEKDVELVQSDIEDELVSIQRAREVYGVVVDPKTRKVDYKATEPLRKEMKKRRKVEIKAY